MGVLLIYNTYWRNIMTRGRLAIITKNKVYTSNEFNGDMYYEGYGESAIEYLKKVESIEYLVEAIKDFNKENFDYPNKEVGIYSYDYPLVFSEETYYSDWGSDYIYIKNVSNEPQTVVTRKYHSKEDKGLPLDSFGEKVLQPGEIGIFLYGRYYGLVKNNGSIEFLN